jgi:hypothetical protein
VEGTEEKKRKSGNGDRELWKGEGREMYMRRGEL